MLKDATSLVRLWQEGQSPRLDIRRVGNGFIVTPSRASIQHAAYVEDDQSWMVFESFDNLCAYLRGVWDVDRQTPA